jgi:hypothetical protein
MHVSRSFTKLALIGILFGACSGGTGGGGKGGTKGNQAGEGGAGAGGGGADSGGGAAGNDAIGGESGSTAGGTGGGNVGGSGGTKATGGNGGTPGTGGKTGGTGGTVAVTGGTGGTIPGLGLPCAMDPNCDNFEGAAPGSAQSQFTNLRGSVTVDTAQAYSGTKSVKVLIGPESRMDHKGNGFLPGDKIYLRAMIYFDTQPKATSMHWNYMHAEGGSEGKLNGIFFATGGWGDAKKMTLYGAGSSGTYADCSMSGIGKAFPAKQWMCAEMQIDAVTNAIKVLYDGKPDDGLELFDSYPLSGGCLPNQNPNNGMLPIPRITKVAFGPKTWHASPGIVMWMDDIAVSNKPIGCPAAK